MIICQGTADQNLSEDHLSFPRNTIINLETSFERGVEKLCFSGGHVKGVATVGPASPSEAKCRRAQPVPLLAVSLGVSAGAHIKTCMWIPILKTTKQKQEEYS